MGSLDGKVAIVTGAGRLRGIGRAAALALAGLGADIVVTGTGRDPEHYPADEKAAGWRDIESTAEEVRAHGVQALPLAFDVRDETAVNEAVARSLEEFGRIDILVNCAGVFFPTRIGETDEAMFDQMTDANLKGCFFMCNAVAPHMIAAGGGRIVNLGSAAGTATVQLP